MGWRGALRTVAAADRRQKRQTQRQLGQLGRISDQVDRLSENIEAECQRDLVKVADAEARIVDRPLSVGGLAYDRDADTWAFKPIADKTGDFKWTLTASMISDKVGLVGGPVVNGARVFMPLAVAFSRWGTFVAFEVMPAQSSSKARKLFTKSDRTKNRVFLRSGDALYQATEGDLDREVIGAGIVIVAFPLPDPIRFGAPVQVEFHISDEPAVVAILGDELHRLVAEAAEGRSLVDQARHQFRQALAPVRAKAAETKAEIAQAAERAKGGCLILIATAGLLGAGCVAAVIS